ncbi:hypothetical protein DQ04_01311080 [Trypanosoma grayi]|uniref:hypothetical protein n=1 Tax=Trypanosoma grayi TaxID=71804 RepID=UPI0004F4B26A|nr:hypothetical protein DQ04_01311080 [Trypanosoma grayi]KEG12949.1 hypothetical protein DQ04_01311080 [Trypanosoma grayi]
MDSLQYQIEQLVYALGNLDPNRTLTQEDASSLQLALANTTAIARSVVERQSCHALSEGDTAAAASPPLSFSVQGREKQAETLTSTSGTSAAAAAIAGSDNRRKDAATDAACQRRNAGGGKDQCYGETLSSIAKLHDVSMDDIRQYNPQLSVFGDSDVLPPNTFIKMKLPINQLTPYDTPCRKAIPSTPVTERPLQLEDMVSVDSPLPLAPLPNVQEARRRLLYMEGMLSSREKSNQRREPVAECADTARGLLLLLPSPSPSRRCPSQDDTVCSNGARDELHFYSPTPKKGPNPIDNAPPPEAAAAATRTPGNTLRVTNTANNTNSAASSVVPTSLLSGSRVAKPPVARPATTAAEPNNKTSVSPTNRISAADGDNSFTTESSSYLSTPTPTRYVSPDTKQLMSSGKRLGEKRSSVEPETPTPDKIGKSMTVEDSNLEDNLCNNCEASPIGVCEPSISLEGGDEYDTLNSIALQYNTTVKDVLQWNPYLIVYEVDEPLPANLPIVLPLQNQDPREQ